MTGRILLQFPPKIAFLALMAPVYILLLTRREFGTDLVAYLKMIEHENGEPLFRAMVQSLRMFELSPIVILNNLAFLSIFIKIITLFQFDRRNILIYFLALIPVIITKDLGTIRQGLSVSFALPAIIIFLKRENSSKSAFMLCFFCVMASSLMHWSGLLGYAISVILYFVCKNLSYGIILILLCVSAVGLNQSLLLEISNLLPFPTLSYKILRYLNYSDHYQTSVSLSLSLVLIDGAALACLLACTPKNIDIGEYRISRSLVVKMLLCTKFYSAIFLLDNVSQYGRLLNLPNLFLNLAILAMLLRSSRSFLLVSSYLALTLASTFFYLVRYVEYLSGW